MVAERARKMSEGDSAEGLLNFINNASSSVKTVLTKPGCFKRNTNHRRFLQKQLKVNTPRKEGAAKTESTKKTFSLSKAKQKGYSKRKSVTILKELAGIATPKTKTSNAFVKDRTDQHHAFFINEHGQLQNEMQYLDECKKFSAIVDDIVDNLLETSSSSSSSSARTSGKQSSVYARSGSVSSYSSSSEEDFHYDFMSGEELVRSLDISELFVPDDRSSPIHEPKFQLETDMIDVQKLPIFENVFQQCSL